MENLPPLPTFEENRMEITSLVEFEVSAEGQHYLFIFQINIDVSYDPESNEIVIDCTEERIDNMHY